MTRVRLLVNDHTTFVSRTARAARPGMGGRPDVAARPGTSPPWDVELGSVRGYSSETFAYSIAESIAGTTKTTFGYQLGDHDSSGVDVWRSCEERVRGFALGGSAVLQRLAVTPAQIELYNLRTRPTKSTDTRSRGFTGESVEVDAIPAPALCRIVEETITQHINPVALELTSRAEQQERTLLYCIAGGCPMSTLADNAAAYAGAGLPVLPLHTPVGAGCSCQYPGCRSVGKHPRTVHGKDDATTDPGASRRCGTRWPDANIGLRPAEGVVVLDVDLRHLGHVHLAELLAEHGAQLPPTLTANTGGGLHIWLACPGPYRGQLCSGVDLKSHTGYVVAPPSLHESGPRYGWTHKRGTAPVPAWLRPLIRRPFAALAEQGLRPSPMSGGRADDGLVRTVATAAEGGRNRALHWAACRAAERGAPAALLDRLRDAARSVGLDDGQNGWTLRSALHTAGRGAA